MPSRIENQAKAAKQDAAAKGVELSKFTRNSKTEWTAQVTGGGTCTVTPDGFAFTGIPVAEPEPAAVAAPAERTIKVNVAPEVSKPITIVTPTMNVKGKEHRAPAPKPVRDENILRGNGVQIGHLGTIQFVGHGLL